MRPWTTPSVMLTEGRGFTFDRRGFAKDDVLAVILPLTCPATMIVSADTVAET
jgi:hypothetical protein